MYRDVDEFGDRFNRGVLLLRIQGAAVLVQLAVCGGLLLFISFYNHTFVHFSFPFFFFDSYSIIMMNIFTCIDDDDFRMIIPFHSKLGSPLSRSVCVYMYVIRLI